MAEKDKQAASSEGLTGRVEPLMPGYWGSHMLIYGDISRLLLRVHRNVAAHMEAHKRLMERLQSVLRHEQDMVLELARVIDEAAAQATRSSNEDRPALGTETMDRIFEHAGKAMQESGKMLTDIQLEALALLQHYIEDARAEPPRAEGDATETKET